MGLLGRLKSRDDWYHGSVSHPVGRTEPSLEKKPGFHKICDQCWGPASRRGDPKAGAGHGGHGGISYQGDKTEPHVTLLGPGGWLVSQRRTKTADSGVCSKDEDGRLQLEPAAKAADSAQSEGLGPGCRRKTETWTETYGFIEKNGRSFCVLCTETVVSRTWNINRHFETNHSQLLGKSEDERKEYISRQLHL
ncbi:hypothetical protein QTO34_017160 [Cnephaeus nilssonii]|uniref:SPIN-DOC-like zinc-finger domain-containing protein n=1 Tax=Cnephaeus nilssonii TaxID=3371016 RepID=A0AA40I1G2_CNENI|nr:hypothetical protein QTO34_017160 [Eptesicus nilssonii]